MIENVPATRRPRPSAFLGLLRSSGTIQSALSSSARAITADSPGPSWSWGRCGQAPGRWVIRRGNPPTDGQTPGRGDGRIRGPPTAVLRKIDFGLLLLLWAVRTLYHYPRMLPGGISLMTWWSSDPRRRSGDAMACKSWRHERLGRIRHVAGRVSRTRTVELVDLAVVHYSQHIGFDKPAPRRYQSVSQSGSPPFRLAPVERSFMTTRLNPLISGLAYLASVVIFATARAAHSGGDGAWRLEASAGTAATLEADADGTGSMRVTISSLARAPEPWHVRLNRCGVRLVAGREYAVRFEASGSRTERGARIGAGALAMNRISPFRQVDIGPQSRRILATFRATTDEPDAILQVGLGTSRASRGVRVRLRTAGHTEVWHPGPDRLGHRVPGRLGPHGVHGGATGCDAQSRWPARLGPGRGRSG